MKTRTLVGRESKASISEMYLSKQETSVKGKKEEKDEDEHTSS